MQRNISVDSDVWRRLKNEATERNKNAREFAGEIISDYFSKAGPEKGGLKAIILAAGMSTRMMELTADKPKCMLEVGGKSILRRQIEIFNSSGIKDIVVVRGYRKEKIDYPGIKYVNNPNYKSNNILESLMSAGNELDDGFIASYSDIIFDRAVLEEIKRSKYDISVVVDPSWKKQYENRFQHPVEEAEKVVIKNGKVVRIAKSISPVETDGEFIGLMRFSKRGAGILLNHYSKLKKKLGPGSPFHTSPSLEKAYMTDMLQELIDMGHSITPIFVKGRWIELDTVEDLKKAERMFRGPARDIRLSIKRTGGEKR